MLIDDMYVASWKEHTGCSCNDWVEYWDVAITWASGLDWIGKDDWYLPTWPQLEMICANQGDLGSYELNYYWSSTSYTLDFCRTIQFNGCYLQNARKDGGHYVRAVRNVPTPTPVP